MFIRAINKLHNGLPHDGLPKGAKNYSSCDEATLPESSLVSGTGVGEGDEGVGGGASLGERRGNGVKKREEVQERESRVSRGMGWKWLREGGRGVRFLHGRGRAVLGME